jgi:Tol biopolymer transport system component/predicted Ser/Thr protein kinase
MADGMVSHFRILGKLGEGGMGVVYRAEDVRLGRPVALKFLPKALAADARALARFTREARAASALNHPNICTIYDIGEEAGEHFIAMELLDGQTLHDMVAGRPMKNDDVIRVGLQVADALDAAHSRGIVHRDIKPANILVNGRGQVKVLDFGLASPEPVRAPGGRAPGASLAPTIGVVDPGVTVPGTVVGTPAYMSPEQARGEALDPRSDLFSLGAVLYELCSGRRAFDGPTTAVVSDAVLRGSPVSVQRLNPQVTQGLAAVVEKALEKDRALRYQSAADLRADLMRLRRDSESGQGAAAATPQTGRWRGRRGAAVAAAAVVLVAAAGGVALYRGRQAVPAVSPPEWVALTSFADSAVSPALSPDGRMVAFIRGAETFFGLGEIYVKLLPDGEPAQMTRDGTSKMDPSFSPDGSQIAYSVFHNGWDTWTVPTLGGTPRLMLANAESLSWIGNHEVLFSEIKTGLHMALATSTDARTGSRDVYVPVRERGMAHRSSLSPDRKWVLVVEMDNGGWLPCRVVPFDGSSRGRPVGPPGAQCTSVAWSPDGQWMYLAANAGNRFHIWRQRFPDGKPEQVTFGATEEEGIAVAPDGRSLITSVGITESTIVVRDAVGERQVTSERYAASPTFSQDGRRLFHLSIERRAGGSRPAGGELTAVDAETGRTEPLLPGVPVTGYAVSADDRWVVYSQPDRDGQPRLWMAELGLRSPPRELASEVPEDEPVLDPGGTVYFRAAVGGSNFLYRRKAGSLERERVIPDPILELQAASPDGRWVVVVRVDPHDPEGRPGLVAQPTDGGPAVTICRGLCDVAWSRDGSAFALHTDEMGENRTMIAPVPTGRAFPVMPPAGGEMRRAMEGAKGTRVLGGDWRPGPKAGLYVSQRRSVHRNLYRISLQ